MSTQKCTTCGVANPATASLCIHCLSPLTQLTQASELAASVAEVRKARAVSSTKMERTAESSPAANEAVRRLLDREFVRPSAGPEPPPASAENPKPEYHPLAERALEKVMRARAPQSKSPSKDETAPLEISFDLTRAESPTPPPAGRKIRRSAASRNDKIEQIEIDLTQGILPFDFGTPLQAALAEDSLEHGLVAAPLSGRVLAGSIDALFISGCFLIFLGIVFFIPDFAFLTKSSLLGLLVVWASLFGAYLFLFTALGGQTLGMQHEHLSVVSFEGEPPSLKEVSLRCFGYFASLGCFSLGFIWAFFDTEKLTWHDRISKTLIVQDDCVRCPE